MKKERVYKFKVRRLSGYVLKVGMLAVLIGVLVNFILLLTRYTSHDSSTNTDIIALVASDTEYLIAGTVCNVFGILSLAVYYFMIGRQYRPYKELIKPNRMFHVLVAMAIAMLSISLAFVMMGWTYKSSDPNRNDVAIGMLVLVAVINLAAVGYEQWAVFQIERDILRARTGKPDEPKDGTTVQAEKPEGSGPREVSPFEKDDPRASANPDLEDRSK